jgi:DNA-binding transcriptional MocR family regulator
MKTNPSGSLISLDTKSSMSWSEQIRIGLMRQIATGGLKPGVKVPSIRALSRELKVTQALIRKAFDQLVADGWLEVRPGLGTFVSDSALGNLTRKSEVPVKNEFLLREEDFDESLSSFAIPMGYSTSDNELPPEFLPAMDGTFLPAHDKLGASEDDLAQQKNFDAMAVSDVQYDADDELDDNEEDEIALLKAAGELYETTGEFRALKDAEPAGSLELAAPPAVPAEPEPPITSESIAALLASVPLEDETWSGVGTGEFLALVADDMLNPIPPGEVNVPVLNSPAPLPVDRLDTGLDEPSPPSLHAFDLAVEAPPLDELLAKVVEPASNLPQSDKQEPPFELNFDQPVPTQSAADELASMSGDVGISHDTLRPLPPFRKPYDNPFEQTLEAPVVPTSKHDSASGSAMQRWARPSRSESSSDNEVVDAKEASLTPAESPVAPVETASVFEPRPAVAPLPLGSHDLLSELNAMSATTDSMMLPVDYGTFAAPPPSVKGVPELPPHSTSVGQAKPGELLPSAYTNEPRPAESVLQAAADHAKKQAAPNLGVPIFDQSTYEAGEPGVPGQAAQSQPKGSYAVQSEDSQADSHTDLEAVMKEIQAEQARPAGVEPAKELKAEPEFYDESGMFAPEPPLTVPHFLGLEQKHFDAEVEGSIWANNLADVFGNAIVYGVAGAGRDLEVSSVTALVEARWQESLRDWIEACSVNQVALSPPAGKPQLREQIARWLRETRGMTCSADDIIVVNGAQEGRDLAARLLIERGRRVAFEEPGSVLNRLYLEAHGAEVMPVNVDESGIIIDELDALEDVPILYTMPSAHFPTGAVLSRNRRLRVLDWAVNTNAMVIEDDTNCEYFYDSRVISSIHAFDTEQRTIYIGSLSHIIPPSWRLGFMVVPPVVRPLALRLKALTTRCTSPVVQRLVLKLFESGFMQEQSRKLQKLCEQRRELLLKELETWPADVISFSPVKGGLTQTIWLPDYMNDLQLYKKCQAIGFTVIPASPCFQTYPAKPGLVLNFGATPAEQMLLGLQKLKGLLTT